MRRPALDTRTGATITIAWVIVANKPFYPMYVWWLVGDGVETSALTLLAIPFFLAVPLVARKSPFSACMALALVSFQPDEKWWQRGLVCCIFVCFAICWWRLKDPVFPWSGGQIAILMNINVFAVASLMTFIGARYAGT